MIKTTLLTLISTFFILSSIGMPNTPSSFSPSSAYAQPSKGMYCFSCHIKEEPETDRGCLSCHEGYDVKNSRKQAALVEYAKRMYGVGSGYECALCHGGDPSAKEKGKAHGVSLVSQSGEGILDRAQNCSKCHFNPDSSLEICDRFLLSFVN
jgi:hypothetical protein